MRLCVGLVLLVGLQQGFSPIVPADRVVPWIPGHTVGVVGGVPNRTTIYTNLSAGATAANIQTAIANCPSNEVVKLGPGSYSIGATISVGGKKGCTLRGSGTNTILEPSTTLGNMFFIGGTDPAETQITVNDGYHKGSSNLVLASVTGLSVGMLIGMDVLNDTNYIWTTGGTERVLRSYAQIHAISGSTITIWPPLHGTTNLVATTPRIYHYTTLNNQAEKFGIEDMWIDCTDFAVTRAVYFHNTVNCWMKGVKTTKVNNYHVAVAKSVGFEFFENWIDDSPDYTPNHAGILVGVTAHKYGVTGALIYNNIFDRVHPGIEVNGGTSGSVIAYNFVYDTRGQSTQGRGIYSNHEAHNIYNLYEGNIVNAFMNDGYFGSTSHSTYYRNWGTGWTPAYTNDSSFTIALCRWSLYENVIGNVWGVTNFTPAYYAITNGSYGIDPAWSHVYRWGYPNAGTDSYTGTRPPSGDPVETLDLNVETTAWDNLNWDSKTKRLVVRSYDDGSQLANSLYLPSKPSWYWNNKPYPPFVATNGYTNLTFMVIPAGARFFGESAPGNGRAKKTGRGKIIGRAKLIAE